MIEGLAPDCTICKGACCEGDAKLFGIMGADLIMLAGHNLVQRYEPGAFTNLASLYIHLKTSNAPNGFYALANAVNDIDGIRLGTCNDLVNGLCQLQGQKPKFCQRMELGGKSCSTFFSHKLEQHRLQK
jgi:hypothetical protein